MILIFCCCQICEVIREIFTMETALGLCTIAITVCIGLIVFTNLSTVKKIAAETAKEEAQKELEKIKSENEKIISEEKKK